MAKPWVGLWGWGTRTLRRQPFTQTFTPVVKSEWTINQSTNKNMYPEKNPVRTRETHGKKIRDQTSDLLRCKARAWTTSSSVPTCYCQTCCLLLAGRQKVLPRILCSARRSVLLCWFIEAEKNEDTNSSWLAFLSKSISSLFWICSMEWKAPRSPTEESKTSLCFFTY